MVSLSTHPSILVLGHEMHEQTTKSDLAAFITAGTKY